MLVVEDNDDVRAYSVMILGEMGYRVLEADAADAALAIIESDRRIDLLFTNVVLPGRSGKALVDEAHRLRPALKVLFTTGYSRNAIVHHGRIDPGVELLSKPFTFEQLAARVRDILDRRQGARGRASAIFPALRQCLTSARVDVGGACSADFSPLLVAIY